MSAGGPLGGGDEARELDAAEQGRAAGELFLEGLLERVYDPGADDVDARIRRAMDAIEDPAPAKRRHRLRAVPGLSTAAALLLGLLALLVFSGPGGQSAEAAVGRSLASALEPTDRRYAVEVELGVLGVRRIRADVYVRGGDRVAVRVRKTPVGELWFGRDGDEFWLAPAREELPVLVTEDADLLPGWLGQRDVELPFLSVTTVLEKVRERYEVSWIDDELLGADEVRLRAERRSGARRLPEVVDLRAEEESGEVRELVLDWQRQRPALGPNRMVFELVGREERSDAWYGFAAHAGAGREVRRH